MGPPPKATKNRFCSLTTIPGKRRPPLCHLDRSAAQWRDLRFSGPLMEMFFDGGNHGPSTQGDEKPLLFTNYNPREAPPSPLSSRPERSAVERSAVQRSSHGDVFRRREPWALHLRRRKTAFVH